MYDTGRPGGFPDMFFGTPPPPPIARFRGRCRIWEGGILSDACSDIKQCTFAQTHTALYPLYGNRTWGSNKTWEDVLTPRHLGRPMHFCKWQICHNNLINVISLFLPKRHVYFFLQTTMAIHNLSIYLLKDHNISWYIGNKTRVWVQLTYFGIESNSTTVR